MKKFYALILVLCAVNAFGYNRFIPIGGSRAYDYTDYTRGGRYDSSYYDYVEPTINHSYYLKYLERTVKFYRLRVAKLVTDNKTLNKDRELYLKVLAGTTVSTNATNTNIVKKIMAQSMVISESETNKVTKIVVFIDGDFVNIIVDRKKTK